MTNQNYLNEYFQTEWHAKSHTDLPDYKYTGYALIDKVKPDEWVLDVGCGNNLYKGKILNLIGIDPANDNADVKTTIEDFCTAQKFDVAFCLGSINFGDVPNIRSQIEKVVSHLLPTARIYWRCNPGLQDHGTEGCKKIDFFEWTFGWHYIFAAEFGYKIAELTWDTDNRIYAEWVR